MSMDSCEKHGWWEVDGQDACPSCEIILLHAEVERLKDFITMNSEEVQDVHQALKRERDNLDAA